jgi:hypothetical protein
MSTPLILQQQWYEVLASRASALGAVLLIASLAVLWLVYARFWWPRLLPLLRAAPARRLSGFPGTGSTL